MGRLTGFRYKDVVHKLRCLGFIFDRHASGCHEIWWNPKTRKWVTIPNHPGDIPEGTLRAILKSAEISVDDFLKIK
jgi:predicted RNA binding protein YcfA (HicA-like mRNA interferase family)